MTHYLPSFKTVHFKNFSIPNGGNMSDQDIYSGLSFESDLRQVGVDGLRQHVAAGTWKSGSPMKHGEAIEVVRRFDASKTEAASAKRDAETLAVAKEANDIARSASFAASAAAASASEANTIARSNSQRIWRSEFIVAIAAVAAIVAAIAAVMGVK